MVSGCRGVCVCVCVCAYVYVCMCVCVCMCVYVKDCMGNSPSGAQWPEYPEYRC